MTTVIVVRESSATVADMVAEALARLARQSTDQDVGLQSAWQTIKAALDETELTKRQRELVLLDLLGLRRSQIADIMHVTPATLTTYWKAIYHHYEVHGVDARAALHRRLFPGIAIQEFVMHL